MENFNWKFGVIMSIPIKSIFSYYNIWTKNGERHKLTTHPVDGTTLFLEENRYTTFCNPWGVSINIPIILIINDTHIKMNFS